MTDLDQGPSVGVAIPCHNEAAAVAAVVAAFRAALPEARILVLENDSTDGTGELAREAGAEVLVVPERGKGNAVRRGLEELATAEVVVLVDGDGTYPADHVRALIAPVLEGRAEMTVGARRPVAELGAMTPIRGIGNVLIRAAFTVLIGPGQGDLLSGYRAFSKTFRTRVRLRSTGFEIETELAGEAVARGLRVVEVPVPYHPRICGTSSKLRAFRDGRRILLMIVALGLRLRPWRTLGLVSGLLGCLALTLRSWPLGLLAASLAGTALATTTWRKRDSQER